MTPLTSALLGALEGLTEFLPVSSTGHLILASHLLGIVQTDTFKSFEIAIQLGSILAVLLVFWKSFLEGTTLKRLMVAFIPTGIVGFLLYRFIKDALIGNPMVVVVALAVGGAALIVIEYLVKDHVRREGEVRDITYRQAFIVGIAQSLAVIPGVSRSGASVMGGLLLGIPRTAILTFSFLLAVPTMLMATAYDLYKTPEALLGANLSLLAIGFFIAFLVALIVIRYALSFVRRFGFAPFGWYRIVLAFLFFFLVLN
jgi:undecaprenyl-diphosphatase